MQNFMVDAKQIIAAAMLLFSTISCSSESPDTASVLQLALDEITVSGVSSGGYMATQFHIAHSDRVVGAAMIASGPYYCARNDMKTLLRACMSTNEMRIDLDEIDKVIGRWENQQLIAPTSNLRNSRVWLFAGTADDKVPPAIVRQLYTQYRNWVPESNLTLIDDKSFAHHFPTLDQGTACSDSKSPYIGSCDYDAAGELLTHLLPDLKPPARNVSANQDNLRTIDQSQLTDTSGTGLAETGYLYVPQNCSRGETCRLHIAFHGCAQNAESVGTRFALLTGYNRWAEANDLVILYPQTKSSLMNPVNPHGCWDWWGYTDERYATRKGQQIRAVKELVQALSNGG